MHFFVFFLISLLSISPAESAASPKKILCLNMIVKNEKDVICRCLESVKPLIDYWVIVDTGSTDGTQDLIRKCMKGIPGELHESKWVDFAHNRNEALTFAKKKADYLLFIDADEMLSFPTDFSMPELTKDFYYILSDFGGTRYSRVALVNNALEWQWKGVCHEGIESPQATTCDILTGIKNIVHTDGSRSKDPQKYQKDAQNLERALQEDPTNTRYQFYLAQSYKDAEMHEPALQNYEKRITMGGGWDQEVFWSLLQVGHLQEKLGKPLEIITNSYYKAYLYRPTRAEPLYYLSHYFRRKGDYFSGYLAAKQGLTIPFSEDALFVERWIHEYGLLLEYSICAYWIGKYYEAQLASSLLLAKDIPQNIRECVNKNMTFIHEKIVSQAVLPR